jgi:amino acid transporter
VSIAALLSTFSAINATIYGNARLGYNIAKDGKLPHKLLLKRREIPFMGVLYTTIFSLILANSIDLGQIAIIGSAGFLLIFFIVNISAYKLKKQINANKYITIISSLLSFIALLILLIYTYQSDPNAVMIFMLFIIISLLFELIYGRFVRGHFFKREY